MSDIETLVKNMETADLLVENATKEQLVECARLLAMNVAHYQSKFGELPLSELESMLEVEGMPTDEQIKLISNGMNTFIGVLGNVVSGIGEIRH